MWVEIPVKRLKAVLKRSNARKVMISTEEFDSVPAVRIVPADNRDTNQYAVAGIKCEMMEDDTQMRAHKAGIVLPEDSKLIRSLS